MEDCNKSFNKGKNNKIAFVFSCPGQEEEKENKPVAGGTGDNLEEILTKIINEPTKIDMILES